MLEIGLVRHCRRGNDRDTLMPVLRNLVYDDPSVESAIILDCHDRIQDLMQEIKAFFAGPSSLSSR